jgi:hypothetical protein
MHCARSGHYAPMNARTSSKATASGNRFGAPSCPSASGDMRSCWRSPTSARGVDGSGMTDEAHRRSRGSDYRVDEPAPVYTSIVTVQAMGWMKTVKNANAELVVVFRNGAGMECRLGLRRAVANLVPGLPILFCDAASAPGRRCLGISGECEEPCVHRPSRDAVADGSELMHPGAVLLPHS